MHITQKHIVCRSSYITFPNTVITFPNVVIIFLHTVIIFPNINWTWLKVVSLLSLKRSITNVWKGSKYVSTLCLKQPPKMFYKKSFSKKFRNIHKKTPALKSLFIKVAGLKLFSRECCKIFKNTILKSICERLLLLLPKNLTFRKSVKKKTKVNRKLKVISCTNIFGWN